MLAGNPLLPNVPFRFIRKYQKKNTLPLPREGIKMQNWREIGVENRLIVIQNVNKRKISEADLGLLQHPR